LIEVGGLTMLERAIRAVRRAGAERVVVNVHHHADQVSRFVTGRDFGVPVDLLPEDPVLETGGGILHAAALLDDGRPFLVHNVDIVTRVDVAALYGSHLARPCLATLAVRNRPGTRRLLFDDDLNLRGREGESGDGTPLAFDGIHVISPELFGKLTERGVFSITPAYLRLVAAGETVRGYRTDAWAWAEIGTPERLESVRRRIQQGDL
ncbi:MAG: NTP transferase domain-containing protein, partial [Elusimicrobia bacterium]|nr:NTP transferase domain-containing protein [Elusimicrobiota bacterium]